MSASVTDPGRNPPTPSGNWLQPSPAVGSTVSGTCLGFVLESMYLHGFGLPMTVAGQAHRARTHTHTQTQTTGRKFITLMPWSAIQGLPFLFRLFKAKNRKSHSDVLTFDIFNERAIPCHRRPSRQLGHLPTVLLPDQASSLPGQKSFRTGCAFASDISECDSG